MKIKTLCLALALLLGCIQSVVADQAFRDHRYDSWKVMSLPENAIVFVGNSITDMPLWTEFFGNDSRVVNRGNSGGYSFEVLDNVESWVRFKPAKVFIKIGTNDLGTDYTEQSIAANIKKTVSIIRRESPNTEIYLQSILPAYDQKYKTLKTIQATNVLIKQIADNTEKTTYIDLYSKMSGILNGSPYSLDNLHLMAYGYKIWTEAIKDYVGLTPALPANTQTIQNAAGLDRSHGMRATYFSVMPIKSTDILFIGDEMVKNGEWQELLHNQNVKNRGSWWGYGGNIASVSSFVDAIFANGNNGVTRETPAKILLYTGTEDINGSTDITTVENNYKALINKIKAAAPSAPIALVSLMPTQNANSRITTFNKWLQSTASADATLTYIDIYTDLATSTGAANTAYFSGNYLYGMGYIKVARRIASYVGNCTVVTDAEATQLKSEFTARTTLNKAILATEEVKAGDEVGQYTQAAMASLLSEVNDARDMLSAESIPLADLQTAATTINSHLTQLKSSINPVTAGNVDNKQFTLSTPNRSGLFAYSNGEGLSASLTNPGYATYRWIIESRTDGTFNIKNAGSNLYMDPSVAHNTQIKLISEAPAQGWTFAYSDALGTYIVRSGTTCELNATTLSGYPVYNWYGNNGNTNRSDAGCQWLLSDVTSVPVVAEPEPIVVVKGTVQEGAATIEDGHVYTITNRQFGGTFYPLYVDNDALQVGEGNALPSKSYGRRAQFVAEAKTGGKYAFKNVETGYYLVWKGNDSGINGNAGVLEEYDADYCDLTLTNATSVTNGKIITGKRGVGTQKGTFVQAANGDWNKWSEPTVKFDASFSNIYSFGDVTDGNDGEVEEQGGNDDPVGDEWEPGLDWYTMQIGASGLYITNNGTAAYTTLNRSKTEFADSDLWYRTGNETEGYTIYNKEAGPGKVLGAPTTMTGTNGGSSYPIMVDKNNVPAGYTTKWLFTPSTNLGNDVEAFYMYEKGYPSNKVNNRNGQFAFWSTGADAGSSIQWKWAQRTVAVNMNTGSFTSTNAAGNWAQTWTSTATAPQLTLNAGANNMSVANSNATRIQAFRGNYEPQAYTLTAGSDYSIAAYSFDFVMSGSTAITVKDAANKTYTSSAVSQTISCTGLTESSTSFTLSGSNNGIDITNMLVTIRKAQIEPEPQFEIFPTLTSQAIPYRIPAIATAYDGTIVAAADYRYSRVDIGSGRIDLHLRRSHDNGQTWDPIMKPAVMTGNGNTTAGNQKAGYGDPCIVGDIESPRMLLTSCSGTPGFFDGTRTHHQGWAHWWSEDNGATWSQPIYQDEDYIYSKFDKSVYGPIRGWFVGSGKICQSRTTKVGSYYRLYCVGSSCREGSRETANWALYSDDFGQTWEFLGGCDYSPVPGGDEPKAEELPDGSILLSSRTTGGRNYNIFTFTDTKTAQGSWGSVAFSGASNNGVTALSNACNGETMLIPVTRKADNKDMFLLLQSVPFGSGRANVGIYYKELESLADYRTPEAIAKNWTGRHQSSYISSAYSTMTWQQDNTIGFVYEEDTYGTNGGGYTIIYKNYSVEQITDSAYTYKAGVDGDSLTALGMQQVVENVTAPANVGSTVGQYTEDAASILVEAYNAYAQNPTRSGYEKLNASIATAPRVGIDNGIYYTIRNYGRGTQNYLLTASTAAVLTATTTTGSDNTKWRFELSPTDPNVYYLYNKKYENSIIGPTLAVETRSVLGTNETLAGVFRVISTEDGLSKFQCLNPTNTTYAYMHLAGDNQRIVPWLANSPAANNASFWYIEPTEDVVTDIDDIMEGIEAISPSDAWYDLQGRPVQNPVSGQIYIGRGKVIRKD